MNGVYSAFTTAAALRHGFKHPNEFQPSVVKYAHKDGWTYHYIQGTGHRLSCQVESDWIEYIPEQKS